MKQISTEILGRRRLGKLTPSVEWLFFYKSTCLLMFDVFGLRLRFDGAGNDGILRHQKYSGVAVFLSRHFWKDRIGRRATPVIPTDFGTPTITA